MSLNKSMKKDGSLSLSGAVGLALTSLEAKILSGNSSLTMEHFLKAKIKRTRYGEFRVRIAQHGAKVPVTILGGCPTYTIARTYLRLYMQVNAACTDGAIEVNIGKDYCVVGRRIWRCNPYIKPKRHFHPKPRRPSHAG